MKRLLALIVVLASLSSVAQAELRAVIKGPKVQQGQAYRDFHLDGSASVGATRYLWIITPQADNGPEISGANTESARVEPFPGVYQAMLVVTDGQLMDYASITFTIPGTPVPPPVPPLPTPTPVPPNPPEPGPPGPPVPHPDPVFPPGKFNISLDIYRAAMAVQSPAKITEAHAVAAGIDDVAQKIKDGKLRGPSAILAAILASNTVALAANKAAWQPFAETMSTQLKRIYLAGMLKDDLGWAALLSEASAGLKAVK